MALARYWEWERTVERELPRVIAEGEIDVLHQPIYRIHRGVPAARGFEAVIRFPIAPRIPLGLWFLMARELDLATSLELAAIKAAFLSAHRLHRDAFLSVDASPETLPVVARTVPALVAGRLLIDLPFAVIRRYETRPEFETTRQAGAGIAIEVAVEDLVEFRQVLTEYGPDCLKVDVSSFGAHETLPKEILAQAAIWCAEAGITLIADRVESLTDLSSLELAGVEWAQGHCLSPPIEL